MFGKKRVDNGEKVYRYSIRKYHFGAASVAVASLLFLVMVLFRLQKMHLLQPMGYIRWQLVAEEIRREIVGQQVILTT